MVDDDGGKSALMVPVNEVPPVSDEIQGQVEEFRQQFLKDNDSEASI